MITSTTELLNELTEVSSQVPGAKPNIGQAPEVSQNLRKEFAMRYRCMQSWYLRCSWVEKIKWLTQMLQALKSIESLSTILNTLKGTYSKSTVYAGCQYTTDFMYDKALQDNNSTMQKKALIETQESDIEWFKICEDSEQILMLLGLIRLGGGSILQQIYKRGVKLYHQKVEELKNIPSPCDGVVEIKAETPRTHMSDYNIHAGVRTRISDHDLISPLAQRTVSIKPDDVNESEVYNPSDPYVIEVENRRKVWNDMITKYRIQVEGKPPKAAKEKRKKGGTSKSSKSSKSGKSSRSGKGSKSDKTSKSGKSSKSGKKKGKKGEDEELDQIQLLPIWIVKRIFNYLDAKTLKKAKTVNKYWAYAVTDLQKDQKARKALDKFIRKMEASVVSSQIQLDAKPKVLRELYDTSVSKKRVLKLLERGATLPKLKGKFKKPLVEKCLATDAVKQMPERYILPVSQLEVFPRSVAQAAPLYKVPSCIVNERGFTKIYFEEVTDEGIEKTYTTVTLSETTHQPGQDGNPVDTTE